MQFCKIVELTRFVKMCHCLLFLSLLVSISYSTLLLEKKTLIHISLDSMADTSKSMQETKKIVKIWDRE